MKRFLKKHNGTLALVLTLVLVVSGSLQLVHDQLLDHYHGSDCVMHVVDGNSPVGSDQGQCISQKQAVETSFYQPVHLVLSQFEKHAPRAPPTSL